MRKLTEGEQLDRESDQEDRAEERAYLREHASRSDTPPASWDDHWEREAWGDR